MRVQISSQRKRLATLFIASMVLSTGLLSGTAIAQQPASSYSDYYSGQLAQRTSIWAMSNTRLYMMDKHIYSRPAVSPYSNLARRANPYISAYQTYVLPEMKRRAYLQNKSRTQRFASMGRTTRLAGVSQVSRGRLSSSYYNHWYGSGRLRGIR